MTAVCAHAHGVAAIVRAKV